MKRVIAALALSLFMVGCNSGLDREKLKDDVMAVHDALMPKWGQLKKLKKQVLEKASSLEEVDRANSEVAELRDLALDLEAAYELMSTWMKDWGVNAKPYETAGDASDEASQKFFQSEQERVDKMEAPIMAAYDAAKEALK